MDISLAERTLIKALPICDCGQPDVVIHAVAKALKIYQRYIDEKDFSPSDALRAEFGELGMWLLAYICSHAELTEHGGGVLASWLTVRGDAFLRCYEEWMLSPTGSDS